MNKQVGITAPNISELTTASADMFKKTAYEATGLWWAWLLRAIVWAVIGIVFIFWQDVGLTTLTILVGAWFLADGVSSIIGGLFADGIDVGRRLLLIIMGILGIAAGVAVIAWPDLTAVTLCIIAAIFGLMWGTMMLFSAIFDGSHLLPRWLQFLLGVGGIAFGVYFLFEPETKIDSLLTVLGALALAGAVLFLIGALNLRSAHKELGAQLKR